MFRLYFVFHHFSPNRTQVGNNEQSESGLERDTDSSSAYQEQASPYRTAWGLQAPSREPRKRRDCDGREARGDSCPLRLLMLNRSTQSRVRVRYVENKACGDRRKQRAAASKGNMNTKQAGLHETTSKRVAQTEGHMRFFNLFYPGSSPNKAGEKNQQSWLRLEQNHRCLMKAVRAKVELCRT